MSEIVVVKLGGTTLADQQQVLVEVAQVARKRPVVLVHGGGKRMTEWLERLGVQTRFENGLLLERWGLDRPVAAPGEQRSLTVLWRSGEPLRRDVAAVLTLRSEERVVWTSQRLPLLGNGDGERAWAAERWIVWSGLVNVPRKLEPGAYVLSIRIGYGREGDFVPVRDPGQAQRPRIEDPKGLELTQLQVRGEPVAPR